MVGNRLVALVAVMFAAGVLFAGPAHADDDMRAMVRDIVQQEMSDSGGLNAKWSSGIRLESADKKFKLKIGGRIMIDHWFIDDDDLDNVGNYRDEQIDSGIEFRRVRLYNSGLIYGNVEYKLQIDFAEPNDPTFKDVYIGITNLDDCFGCLFPSIRVGHFKQPFGLEQLTSSKYITFMERSAATNAFTPGRKYGVMLHDRLMGDQFTWAVSYWLREEGDDDVEDDGDADFDEGWGVAARLTYTPWYDCECACRRLHIGAGFVYVTETQDQQERFRARPYTHHTDTRLVDTGTMNDVEDWTAFNIELALVYGPWSVQGEYFFVDVTSTTAGDPSFSGWYAQASYWLTGECRNYSKGKFGRVKPCCNFLDEECCCYGAFELAVRYDYIDLEDANVAGGEQGTLVVGLNWHLNPNTRLMLNYFIVDVEGGPVLGAGADESMSGLGIRFQVDW